MFAVIPRNHGQAVGKFAEFVAHGHEVGFTVGFQQSGNLVVGRSGYHQCTFGSHTAGFLVSLGKAGFAHVLDGCFDITTDFLQGFFAFHHACAGTLAQLFHQLGRNTH